MSGRYKKCLSKVLAAALLLSFTAGLLPMQEVADSLSLSLTAKALEYDPVSCTCENGALVIRAGTYNNPTIPDTDDNDNPIERYNVTSITLEGPVVFKGNCTQLFSEFTYAVSINLSQADTTAVTSMAGLFQYDYNLEKVITGTGFQTTSVTDMNHMFFGCSSLTNFDFSALNTSQVTDMSNMFYNCCSLKTLNVSSFLTGAVTTTSYMFANCSSLKTLDLSTFALAGETDVYGMFSACTGLEDLTLSDGWDITSSYELPNRSFQYAGWYRADDQNEEILSGDGEYAELSGGGRFLRKKTDVVFSYDPTTFTLTLESGTYSGETISELKELCMEGSPDYHYEPNLRKIVIKDGVVLTGDFSFAFSQYNYFGGLEIEMGAADTSGVTNMSYMFQYCIVDGTLDLSSFDTSGVTDMAGMFSEIKGASDGDGGFADCSITFGDGFTTSRVENMSNMFDNARVDELDLSGFDTAQVTTMSNMFSGCSAAAINLSSFDTSQVEDMSYMFCGCSVQEPDVSRFVTANVTTMQSMFKGCSVAEIDISHFSIPSESSYSYSEMFAECPNLTAVTFPADWKPKSLRSFFAGCTSMTAFDFNSIDCSQLQDISSMFDSCESLTTVTIPAITTLTNMYELFKDCASLTSVDLSTIDASSINYFSSTFEGCSSLQTIVLPEITKNDASFGSCFEGCSALQTVNLANIKSQGIYSMDHMFSGCSSLTTIDLSNAASNYSYFSMYGAFADCTALETLKMPAFTRAINDNNAYSFKEMFRGAENLQSLTFNSGNLQNTSSYVLESLMLENANYLYTGWHFASGDRILSGSGDYAAFSISAGATYVRDRRHYDKTAVKGASLTLDGQIGLNFYCELPDDFEEGAYVLVSSPKGQQKTLLSHIPFDKKNGYKISTPLSAKQIHDKVTISFFRADDAAEPLYTALADGTYDELENNECAYAVADYIHTVQEGTGYSGELTALVNALEAYGSYAQVYFGYKPDTADVSSLAAQADMDAITAESVSAYQFTLRNSLPDALVFKGYSLLLESETALRLYFESESIGDYFSEEQNLRENMTLTHVSGNTYCVEIRNISADCLSDYSYFTFHTGQMVVETYGNGESYSYEVMAQIVVSPLSYVYSALAQYGGNAEKAALCNTMKALKLYGDAARTYLNT